MLRLHKTLFHYIGLNKAIATQEDEAHVENTNNETPDSVQSAVASQDLSSISSKTKKKKKKGEYPVLNDMMGNMVVQNINRIVI